MARGTGDLPVALGAYAVVAAAFVVVAAAGADVTDLLDDPLALSGIDRDRPWAGSLSIVGGMLWVVAATACAFAAALVDSRRGAADDVRFLRATAAVALVLAVDDMLLIHDGIVPVVAGRLGAEYVVLAALLLMAAAWAVTFRARILERSPALAVLTAACFALSGSLDVLGSYDGDSVPAAVEDVAKLLGIGTFAVLAVRWSWEAVTAALRPPDRVDGGAPLRHQ